MTLIARIAHTGRTSVLLAATTLASTATTARSQAAQSGQGKLDDPTIVAIFDAANTWDIETGNLAAKKASSKAVRDFGAMLARDHNMVRQQGRDLAAKLGVTPTPPKDFAMAKDHANVLAKLNAASGTLFDRAFLEHEVAYHRAVLDAVTTTLLPALKNQEVKDLVNKVAPAFQAHMLAAQNLLEKEAKAAKQ